MISDGMIALALLAMGTQISFQSIRAQLVPLLWSSVGKLLIAPLCAFALISLFQLDGIVAQTLLIASGMPTSRNSVALAMEYENHTDFAVQSLLLSTILSVVTLPILIYLAKIYL